MKRVDLFGQRFGRLVVLGFSGLNKHNRSMWRCVCDCGTVVEAISSNHLQSGNTQSCGCLSRELVSERSRTHGLYKHPLYHRWANIKERCTNPNNSGYRRYGGRGITMCDRWMESFPAFLEDMGEIPFPGASVERVNNNGNYEPGNCVWADHKTQQDNRNMLYGEKYERAIAMFAEMLSYVPSESRPKYLQEFESLFGVGVLPTP